MVPGMDDSCSPKNPEGPPLGGHYHVLVVNILLNSHRLIFYSPLRRCQWSLLLTILRISLSEGCPPDNTMCPKNCSDSAVPKTTVMLLVFSVMFNLMNSHLRQLQTLVKGYNGSFETTDRWLFRGSKSWVQWWRGLNRREIQVLFHKLCPDTQAGGCRLFLCTDLDEHQNPQSASLLSLLLCCKHASQTVPQTLASCSLYPLECFPLAGVQCYWKCFSSSSVSVARSGWRQNSVVSLPQVHGADTCGTGRSRVECTSTYEINDWHPCGKG